MKIFGRGDRVLLAGLGVAVLVLFVGRAAETPLRLLVDFTRSVEQQSGLALVPALFVLTLSFVIHQQGKRREARAQVRAVEVEMVQAHAHSAELERLVVFGQALSRSLDIDAIREALVQHLPTLAGTDRAWVLTRKARHWQQPFLARPVGEGAASQLRDSLDRLADRTSGDGDSIVLAAAPVDRHLCIPLTASGYPIGILGVPEPEHRFAEAHERVLDAVAALLGVSLGNAQLFREVRESSVRDGLTGCFNRTHAVEVIDIELRRTRRSQQALSLIMFDLDHFKAINDRFGHLCGDAVLAAVGSRMRAVLRGSDLKCRYGGEEFLVLLPATPIEGAMRVADNLRRELPDLPIAWNAQTLHITASFGVTTANPSENDVQALIGRADQALYRAKAQGRNCVRLITETAVV